MSSCSHVIQHITSSFLLISNLHRFCAWCGPINRCIAIELSCYCLQTKNQLNSAKGLQPRCYLSALPRLIWAVRTLSIGDHSNGPVRLYGMKWGKSSAIEVKPSILITSHFCLVGGVVPCRCGSTECSFNYLKGLSTLALGSGSAHLPDLDPANPLPGVTRNQFESVSRSTHQCLT